MDFSAVGKKIKELRKQIGLSQGELANGICTQAQISKIEKGDVYPYASTLYLISERLGVDVNYFFDIGLTPRLDYVQEVTKQLKLARRTMNYEEMKQIVKMEEKNPLFSQNKRNYQLLLWHKAIYEHAMNKSVEKAIGILQEAIALTQSTEKFYSERELELMLTLGVIYFEENDFENALYTYQDALRGIKQLPYLNDISIQTRLYYNIARALTNMSQYTDSNKHCKDGIDWCIKRESLYLLGELHYHIGYNFELQGDTCSAIQYMEKACLVFELQNDQRFLHYIKDKIEKLK